MPYRYVYFRFQDESFDYGSSRKRLLLLISVIPLGLFFLWYGLFSLLYFLGVGALPWALEDEPGVAMSQEKLVFH